MKANTAWQHYANQGSHILRALARLKRRCLLPASPGIRASFNYSNCNKQHQLIISHKKKQPTSIAFFVAKYGILNSLCIVLAIVITTNIVNGADKFIFQLI